jgi:hypothetical protein
MATVNDRPVLSSERAHYINKTATNSNKSLVLGTRWGLTSILTGRLTVGRSVTLTLTGVLCVVPVYS